MSEKAIVGKADWRELHGVDPASIDIRDAWKDVDGELARAALAGAGFSFKYGGITLGPLFSSDWTRSVSHDPETGVTRTTLAHESGLAVTRETRIFRKFGAIEYKLRFKNTGAQILPPVSALQALNVSFLTSHAGDHCVVSSGGGMAEGVLPPKTFAISKRRMQPGPLELSEMELTTEGGRSSRKDLPFFFIQNDALNEGIFVAFGWSGQWGAQVQSEADRLQLRGRIPDLNIALEPGEEIQGPTVLLGLYQGELADGSNRLRRLIRNHYTPKLAGADAVPAITYDTYYGMLDQFDETILKKAADEAAAIGEEYFKLDAGWFPGERWFTSVGNWEGVNQARLPNGLKPIADYVQSKGMKLGLWFEPERVAEGSQLAREHPEWVLWNHGKTAAPWLGHVPWVKDNSDEGSSLVNTKLRFGLLDFGRSEVQIWVRDMIDRHVREAGVKYIRYDMNMDPLPFWEADEEPNRRGSRQIRHIQGLYSVIEWLHERHPDVLLECCASGGLRIDLETVKRFHAFWISDYSHDPAILRFHLFGINHFLPGNYNYTLYTQEPSNKNFHLDDLGFQSLFGGALGASGHLERWPPEMKDKARLHFATFKTLRRYLLEDYYPLSPQPIDLASWSGWQFNDPNDRSGFLQTFRTKTPEPTHRFFAKGLDAQARYRFSDAYSSDTFEMLGAEAMTKGISFEQEPMTSKVFVYHACENRQG